MSENKLGLLISAFSGIVGVLIGSIIPWLQSSFRESRIKRNDADYLAIRIVTILEKYILSCIDVVYDDGTSQGQPAGNDGCYEHQIETPAHIAFPDDINWRSIDSKLMFKLLSLPNLAHEADRSISFSLEFAGPPDYSEFFEERQKKYAQIGLYALDVESELRKKYKIPNRNHEHDWSPKDVFEKRIKEIEGLEDKRQKQNQIFLKL
jgi:hypothetical protein